MTIRHLLLALVVMAIWGANFAIAKLGLQEVPPITFMCMRFLIVAALLVPFVKRPTDKWLHVLGYSFTLGGIHFGFMFTALSKLDASTAALATQAGVPIATIMAAFIFKDYPGWKRIAGIAIAFAGLLIIAGEPRFEGGLQPLIFVLIAAAAWAAGAIQVKLMGDIDGFVLNGWMALFAAPQLAVLSLIFEHDQIGALLNASPVGWGSILYQSVFVVIIGYGIWYSLLKRFPVSQTMPLTLMGPVLGVLAGVVILGEQLTVQTLIGGALTIFGVGIIVLRQSAKAAFAEEGTGSPP